MKPRILLTSQLPPKTMAFLSGEADLELAPLARLADHDGLLCQLTDSIDGALLDSHPGLKVVSNYAVGFNNIDVPAATARKVPVTNTPGVLTETTADMAWALLFAVARRAVEGDRLVRAGQWQGWEPLQFLGGDVTGATLGLVGLGRIGKAMAQRARGFDMELLYWNRTRLPAEEESALGLRYRELDDVLEQADFVSVHVALNAATRHLIGRGQLARMKPTAYLINTARGAVVDEGALVEVLERGGIAGAGLDVYENEPALHPGLAGLPNTVLAPHLGSATVATREKMGMLAAKNCLAACAGERPPNVLNPEIYD